MPFSAALVNCPHEGAYLCAGWDLRVTARCLTEDLGWDADVAFERLTGQHIIRAMIRERSRAPEGHDLLTRTDCGQRLCILRHGDRHRAITWWDEEQSVVWMLAYGRHQSGSPDDAYQYFRSLVGTDGFLPSVGDYQRHREQKNRRLLAAIRLDGPLLYREAVSSGGEAHAKLAGSFGTAITVEVADDLQSARVAIDYRTLPDQGHPKSREARLIIGTLLNAVRTTALGGKPLDDIDWQTEASQWASVDRLASRPTTDHEIAFEWCDHVS